MSMKNKETSIEKRAERKAVDEALIAEVLSRVAEIGVRKAAEEAGIAWQTVNKWKKDAEKMTTKLVKEELTTPEDIKAAVEGVAEIMNAPAEEKAAAPAAEEKPIEEECTAAAPVVEEETIEEECAAETPAAEEEEVVPALIIESTMGGQISADEIIKRVKEKRSDAAKIYVKPEENKAYFTYGDSVGHVELW